MSQIAKRLAELNIVPPKPSTPVAAYVPYVITGTLVFISGQLPYENGEVKVLGKLGDTVSVEAGIHAARQCGLNMLAHLQNACGGDLDRVTRCVKLGGFVASTPDFFDQPKIINGASELIEQVFGEQGRHARCAVGVPALPRNAAVEVDGVFEIGG